MNSFLIQQRPVSLLSCQRLLVIVVVSFFSFFVDASETVNSRVITSPAEGANCATLSADNSRPPAQSHAQLRVSFQPAFNCHPNGQSVPSKREKLNSEACSASTPQDWRPEEQQLIERGLSLLSGIPKLQKFLAKLNETGPINFFRSSNYAEINSRGAVETHTESHAFESKSFGGIVFTNHLFNEAKRWKANCKGEMFPDPAKEIASVILHELSHRYSAQMKHLHRDCHFLRAINYNVRQEQFNFISNRGLNSLRERGRSMRRRGEFQQAADWSKNQARRFGFPTLYSMSDPDESFAEILTFSALDENAQTTIKPEISAWFNQNVFESSRTGQNCAGRPL